MWMLLLAWMSAPARATWSVVAVDEATGEVGIAGATCGPFVWGIAGVAPGKGVIAAQYATWRHGRELGAELLGEGETPEDILATLQAEDAKAALRQYGIAAFSGPAIGWSGDEVEPELGVLSGDSWSVQGNTLASGEVLADAEAAFLADPAAALGDRLLAAMEAGAARGGDARCDPESAAKSAFLYVAAPGDDADDPAIEVRASGQGAVALLAERYHAEWSGCATAAAPASFGGLAALGLLLARRR